MVQHDVQAFGVRGRLDGHGDRHRAQLGHRAAVEADQAQALTAVLVGEAQGRMLVVHQAGDQARTREDVVADLGWCLIGDR